MSAEQAPFRFNFNSDQAEEHVEEEEPEYNELAEEVTYRPSDASSGPRLAMESVKFMDGLELVKGLVTNEDAAVYMGDERVSASDLLPGTYEGGFKLWECSLDLCKYLVTSYKVDPATLLSLAEVPCDLRAKKVLELGCGHGLPGIVAALCGAEVHFQDYNKAVLQRLTVPNVLANLAVLPASRPRRACKYFCGDWRRVGELLTGLGYGGHYDVILSSETIYSEHSQERLLECIKQLLQPPHGLALVAAKRYYFGVGGGTKSFRALVKDDGIFDVEVVAEVEEPGSSNVREVLALRFPAAIMPYFL